MVEERRQAWNDRQMEEMFVLVKQTRDQVMIQNGTIKRHNEEIFGNNNYPGLRKEVDECHDFVIATRSSVKTIVTLVSVIGIANIIAVVLLIANLSKGAS